MRCLCRHRHPLKSLRSSCASAGTDAAKLFDEMLLLGAADNMLGARRSLEFCTARFIHESAGLQFTVVPGTTAESPSMTVSEATERICRVVSTQPEMSVESSLDRLGVAVSPVLVAQALKNLSNAGTLALMFFRWAERQDGFHYTAEGFHNLIEALGKIKQFRLVWSLVEAMRCRGLLSKDTFRLIVRRYARARKIKEAIETFEKMESFGLRTELSDYNWLIDTLSKSKQVRKAHAIFKEMRRKSKFVPDLKTYTILMEGWGQEKDLSMLKAVYQELLDAGFKPDVVTYGILISAFCKSGNCNEAIKVFHEMEASGCKPSPHVYCMLINGLGSEEQLDEALKYFELSKANGFPPEVPTCNAVVGTYCRASKFQHAFRMVDEMRKCGIGPNARTYDIILQHLIKAQKIEEAYNTFLRMGRRGVNLRLEEACAYFQEMLDKGIRPPGQLFSSLKEALVEAGRIDLAQEMAFKLDVLRKTPLPGWGKPAGDVRL